MNTRGTQNPLKSIYVVIRMTSNKYYTTKLENCVSLIFCLDKKNGIINEYLQT